MNYKKLALLLGAPLYYLAWVWILSFAHYGKGAEFVMWILAIPTSLISALIIGILLQTLPSLWGWLHDK